MEAEHSHNISTTKNRSGVAGLPSGGSDPMHPPTQFADPEPAGLRAGRVPDACRWTEQSLTCIKDSLQCLDVCGDTRDPVDADLLNASLLHLLDALAHNVRHLGALAPGSERRGVSSNCWTPPAPCSQIPQGVGQQPPTAPHTLCHNADFDPEDSSLLFRWGPFEAHVSACELHGELHLDLQEMPRLSSLYPTAWTPAGSSPWGGTNNPTPRKGVWVPLTPFISITSMCQFLVCTACGSSCGEKQHRRVLESPPAATPPQTAGGVGQKGDNPGSLGLGAEPMWDQSLLSPQLNTHPRGKKFPRIGTISGSRLTEQN